MTQGMKRGLRVSALLAIMPFVAGVVFSAGAYAARVSDLRAEYMIVRAELRDIRAVLIRIETEQALFRSALLANNPAFKGRREEGEK